MIPPKTCADAVRSLLPGIDTACAGIRDPEQRAGHQLAMARIHHLLGDHDAARRAADQARTEAAQAQAAGATPMLDPAVIHAFLMVGERTAAREMLLERLGAAWKVSDPEDRRIRVLLLLEMAGVLGDKETLSKGIALVRARDPKGFAAEETRDLLAGAWLVAGDTDRAIALSNTLPTTRRAVLHATIATARRTRGDRAGAAAAMAKVLPWVAAEKDETLREMTLGIVLAEMARQGDTAAALRRAGRSPALRRSVAEALLESGKLEQGLAVGAPPRPTTIYALAQRGEIERARQALATVTKDHGYFMQDDVVRMVAAVAAAAARAGDMEAFGRHLAEGRALATTKDPVFGDTSASMLLSFAEALLTGGWRPNPRR